MLYTPERHLAFVTEQFTILRNATEYLYCMTSVSIVVVKYGTHNVLWTCLNLDGLLFNICTGVHFIPA
jgi:hypothetical protein